MTSLLQRTFKGANQKPDEEIHRTRSPNEGVSALVELGAPHGGAWKHSVSPVGKLSGKGPPGFLRCFFYTVVIDKVTGHW